MFLNKNSSFYDDKRYKINILLIGIREAHTIFDTRAVNVLLGTTIQNKRKLRHLSTHELSAELFRVYGISVSAMTISRVERGNVISSDKLFAIASFLEINLTEFTSSFPTVK